MANREDVTPEYVRQILDYCPETGALRWKQRPRSHFASDNAFSRWNTIYPGSIAGHMLSSGYIQVSINDMRWGAHRLAFAIMTSEWPKNQIDHRDRNPSNNRWENLREATNSQNNYNKPSKNKHGYKGVRRSWGRWSAMIRRGGKKVHLGSFATKEEASAAYIKSATIEHGKFACFEVKD